jgi:hypothetical protein
MEWMAVVWSGGTGRHIEQCAQDQDRNVDRVVSLGPPSLTGIVLDDEQAPLPAHGVDLSFTIHRDRRSRGVGACPCVA